MNPTDSDYEHKSDPIHFDLVMITPALAKTWLEKRDPRNRLIAPQTVRMLANEMLAGKWRITHQPIAFDHEDRLFDGQHRLSAIVTADVPIRMYCARYRRDEREQAKLACDIGRARSVGNVLDITGTTQKGKGKFVTAVVTTMMFGGRNNTARLSPGVVADYYAKHRVDIDQIMTLLPRKEFGAVVVGAMAHARPLDPARVEEFASLVVDKSNLRAGSAAHLFVQAQARGVFAAGSGGSSQRAEIFRKVTRLVVAHMRGENIDRLHESSVVMEHVAKRRIELGIDPVPAAA